MGNTRSFNEVLSLAEVQGKMPFLKRYLRREETAREISHCHADLDQALTLFSVCIPHRFEHHYINRKIRLQFKSERLNLCKLATSIAQNVASNQFQNAAPPCRRPQTRLPVIRQLLCQDFRLPHLIHLWQPQHPQKQSAPRRLHHRPSQRSASFKRCRTKRMRDPIYRTCDSS